VGAARRFEKWLRDGGEAVVVDPFGVCFFPGNRDWRPGALIL
jgi:hypothetical protein